jgi:hypothetical protein
MSLAWSRLLRLPQTYLLLGGIILGYGSLIAWAGPRPVAYLGGGGIAVAMTTSWAAGFRKRPPVGLDASDVLAAATCQQRLADIAQTLPDPTNSIWGQARDWAMAAQGYADHICQRDPLLRADLLEAMHTVLDLTGQVAEALRVMAQIQTPAYRQLAQQRLQASHDRLRDSVAQLQQLQDQIALASLEPGGAPLPDRLQQLIAANRQILRTASSDPT